MPIENIASYDFRQVLTPQQVFDYLREGLAEQISRQFSTDVVGKEYLKLKNGSTDCLIYEMNDKLYPGLQLAISNDSDCYGITYLVSITPFNVFMRQCGASRSDSNEDTKNVELTKIHRKVMKDVFGEKYQEAKELFIDEVKDVQLKFAKIDYDNAVQAINEKYKNDASC